MATGLTKVLTHLQQMGAGQTDGQLLTRFVGTRDEASFAALVRRHGPMVLGVCRRVLHDFHDAEDAFQATFLVLARKAASVVKRESVSCWLFGTAYRTAMEARTTSARRQARERPMRHMPHPEVAPAEAADWRPILDRELNLLPRHYQAAIVLCDLEGLPRREAAQRLGIPEGTLSSRLANGRKLLAKRLAGCGVAFSGGALAVALSQGVASAQVPALLVTSTAKAAALVAAGQMAAVSTPAAVLMREVMKTMLIKKLRLAVGAVMVLTALGAVGVGYQAGGGSGTAQAAPPDRPLNELEALRKENELLKLNLQVVLEKVRAQENDLQGLRKQVASRDPMRTVGQALVKDTWNLYNLDNGTWQISALNDLSNGVPWVYPNNTAIGTADLARQNAVPDAARDAECAVKALREAKDKEGQRRATESLDKAIKKLKEQLK